MFCRVQLQRASIQSISSVYPPPTPAPRPQYHSQLPQLVSAAGERAMEGNSLWPCSACWLGDRSTAIGTEGACYMR